MRPKHEIDWDERKKVIPEIKEGDPVWLGHGDYPCRGGIFKVARLTPTQIVIAANERYRGERRFRRMDGFQVGGVMFSDFITAVATPAEVKEYEAEQQRKADAELQKKIKQAAVESKRAELTALFGDPNYTYVDNDPHDTRGEWSVTMSGLSEKMVRTIATLITGGRYGGKV